MCCGCGWLVVFFDFVSKALFFCWFFLLARAVAAHLIANVGAFRDAYVNSGTESKTAGGKLSSAAVMDILSNCQVLELKESEWLMSIDEEEEVTNKTLFVCNCCCFYPAHPTHPCCFFCFFVFLFFCFFVFLFLFCFLLLSVGCPQYSRTPKKTKKTLVQP